MATISTSEIRKVTFPPRAWARIVAIIVPPRKTAARPPPVEPHLRAGAAGMATEGRWDRDTVGVGHGRLLSPHAPAPDAGSTPPDRLLRLPPDGGRADRVRGDRGGPGRRRDLRPEPVGAVRGQRRVPPDPVGAPHLGLDATARPFDDLRADRRDLHPVLGPGARPSLVDGDACRGVGWGGPRRDPAAHHSPPVGGSPGPVPHDGLAGRPHAAVHGGPARAGGCPSPGGGRHLLHARSDPVPPGSPSPEAGGVRVPRDVACHGDRRHHLPLPAGPDPDPPGLSHRPTNRFSRTVSTSDTTIEVPNGKKNRVLPR